MGRVARFVLCLWISFVLIGCAASGPLKIQDTSGITRIGLIVSVVEDKVNVLDHTGVWRYEPMMPQYGVPGLSGADAWT